MTSFSRRSMSGRSRNPSAQSCSPRPGTAKSAVMRSLLLLLALGCLHARAAQLVLVAGGGTAESDRPATECRLVEPFGVEFGPDGSMWIPEMVSSNRLLRVAPNGILKALAANGKGFAGDGGP